MRPFSHLISGVILSSILIYFFPEIGWLGFFLIVFSTVFIDVDHYLFYVAISKDLSLKNAYDYFVQTGNKWKSLSKEQRKELKNAFYVFHGIEILILVWILSIYVSNLFYFFLIGMGLHLLADWVVIFIEGYKIHKISVIYDILKFEKKKLINPIK